MVDRCRPRFGRNRDCRKEDLVSDFGVVVPSPELLLLLLLKLLMRKKFLNFWGNWLLEPFKVLLDVDDVRVWLLGFRFSDGRVVDGFDEERKNCVMTPGQKVTDDAVIDCSGP